MQDPQQYFNTIAQMIVQSAAASAAQDEARMQREQDLSFRREQLGLDRERLAQQGRESDARVANVNTETEARKFDLKRAKSKDATEAVDEQIFRMESGEDPGTFAARNALEDRQMTRRLNTAKVTEAEAEVDPNSPKNLRMARRDDAAIAASDAQAALAAANLKEFEATATMRRELEKAELEGKQAMASKSKLDFANAKVESRFARLGMLSPIQMTHLNEGKKDQIRKTYLDAISRGVTDPVTGVTDFKALEDRIANVDSVVDVALRFEMLRGMDPAKASQAQAMFRALGQDLAISSPDAYSAGKTMVKAMTNVLDIMVPSETMPKKFGPPAPPPDPNAKESEAGRRLRVKSEAETTRKTGVKSKLATAIESMSDKDFAAVETLVPDGSKEDIAAFLQPHWDAAEADLQEQYDNPPQSLILQQAISRAKGRKPLKMGRSEKIRP